MEPNTHNLESLRDLKALTVSSFLTLTISTHKMSYF